MLESKKREFVALYQEMVSSWLDAKEAKWVVERHLNAPAEARNHYAEIAAAKARGEDVTDRILLWLLPHKDSKFNVERGAWSPWAPAITKDVKEWFQGAKWTQAEDWSKVTDLIWGFVSSCEASRNNLVAACRAFETSPLSKGFKAGMLTPIISALRPTWYCVVNAKPLAVVNYFFGTSFSSSLRDYPDVNRTVWQLVEEMHDVLSHSGPPDIPPYDRFDMYCHYLVAVKKLFKPDEEEPNVPNSDERLSGMGYPFSQLFSEIDEANGYLNLMERCLSTVGITGPDDERSAITFSSVSGGPRITLNVSGFALIRVRYHTASNKRVLQLALPANIPGMRSEGSPFGTIEEGREFAWYTLPWLGINDLEKKYGPLLSTTWEAFGRKVATYKRSSHRKRHLATLFDAITDHSLRPEILARGLGQQASGIDVQYWLFQCNPQSYRLVDALAANAVRNWRVTAHKDDIHEGDRVALWVTGDDGGLYAIATVESEPALITEGPEEFAFWNDDERKGEPFTGVGLVVDQSFHDRFIPKEIVLSTPELRNLPVGSQGTNFKLTKEQFLGLETLAAPAKSARRYWLLAAGSQGTYWPDFFDKGYMGIGWNQLGDLRQYASREDIRDKLAATIERKSDFRHDSLALWDFAHTIKPGDIVITKKGRTDYLGFGIVAGEYTYDETLGENRHRRSVSWKSSEPHSSGEYKIVTKTLTDITSFSDYVRELSKLMGIDAASKITAPNLALPSKNIILYGPPGTGKTWNLRNEFFKMFTEFKTIKTSEERALDLVKELTWWQVIALAMLDTPGNSAKVNDIIQHPLFEARLKLASNRNSRALVWGVLQTHTKNDCEWVKYANRIAPQVFSKDKDSLWTIDTQAVAAEAPELNELLREYRRPPSNEAEKTERYRFTTFHQAFSYEDFIEGIKPQLEDADGNELEYEIKDGLFKKVALEATANPGKNYAIFIDEINRGNIASIFGELITLIEDDKRLGAENELKAVLPYSGYEFGVPGNLFIIGTMNTADRSVEALDTALRRRFSFVEMRPDRDKIPAVVPGLNVDLRLLFDAINDRIEQLLDHDHCIGHAYFMDIKTIDDLRASFKNKIIPLLREYFYGSPARVGMVLGNHFVRKAMSKRDFANTSEWGDDELDRRGVFVFEDAMTRAEEDFRSIYA